jgi:hypothetical protein
MGFVKVATGKGEGIREMDNKKGSRGGAPGE